MFLAMGADFLGQLISLDEFPDEEQTRGTGYEKSVATN